MQKRLDLTVNDIARKQGTNVMDKVFYNANAPHNQPFNLNVTSKQKKS